MSRVCSAVPPVFPRCAAWPYSFRMSGNNARSASRVPAVLPAETAHAPSVPRRGMRPGLSRTPPKQRGRAGCRGLAGPHVWCGKGRSTRICLPRVPEAIPASRTRWFFGLLRANPGGVTKAFLFGRGPSIHRWRVFSPARSCLGHGKRQTREDPVARGQRAGHRTAWAAETRVRRTLRPPRPRSASRNRLPEGAPFGERG